MARDSKLGIDVLLECENGEYREACQLIFVEQSGKLHHLLLGEGLTPRELAKRVESLDVQKPFDVHLIYGAEDREWLDDLVSKAWPAATFGTEVSAGTKFENSVTTVVLTDRYFRAVAKIGFHYFLTQFSDFRGDEDCFARIRKYILMEGQAVTKANEFINKRQHPLLRELMRTGTRPSGWRAHVLCAEIKARTGLAHVQTFLTEDWPAPIYTVRITNEPIAVGDRAAGHAFIYFEEGPKGRFAGEAIRLSTTRLDYSPPPSSPVIEVI